MAFHMSKLHAVCLSLTKSVAFSPVKTNTFAQTYKFTNYCRPQRSIQTAVVRGVEGSINISVLNSRPSSRRVINTVGNSRKLFSNSTTFQSVAWRSCGTLSPLCRRRSAPALLGLGLGLSATTAALHTGALLAMSAAWPDLDLGSDKTDWQEAKNLLHSMSLEKRRQLYRTKDYIPLEKIPAWNHTGTSSLEPLYEVNDELNQKIFLFQGDITKLEIDAIANAANKTLLGGGGVDGAIHRMAGPLLRQECATLGGCETGEAKITGAYGLPARHVIHTVGPIVHGLVGETEEQKLRDCYYNCLDTATKNNLRTVAFPCISTGVYGYPPEQAVKVALKTVREYLNKHHEKVDGVIFCVFLKSDLDLYETRLPAYFPKGASPKSKL